jgi:hypothetical protein
MAFGDAVMRERAGFRWLQAVEANLAGGIGTLGTAESDDDTLPLIVAFLFFQKQFIAGITAGAVKQ